MEFLSLEKCGSADKKIKNSHKGRKRKIDARVNKTSKKSRNEVKKLFSSEIDNIDAENKSAEESLSNEISQQIKEISEDETNEKTQIRELFVNMKRVIINEEEVKEIHPDVISVRFPRKKRSRWCWAVFDSEIKAAKALTELKTRNDIIVAKAHVKSKTNSKKKIKASDSKQKKIMKTKIREAWM